MRRLRELFAPHHRLTLFWVLAGLALAAPWWMATL